MSGKFDAAIRTLYHQLYLWGEATSTVNKEVYPWTPESRKIAEDNTASHYAAIAVLEAAGKVDKQKSIDALNGYFVFLAGHGFTEEDPLVVAVMALLEALPEDK